ncbi:hypothetical protein [Marinobacter sp.]|jgi:hypothetical protein|uniref:DUF7483 domain-containing protein n=1 Tax=Marinobacter sp. TaxID=50741 RepID=UPI00235291E3|nr:hypothetical protein [Marinobacter sp.]
MSGMFGASNFFFGDTGFYPYEINSSCRFNSDQSSCMEKTFSGAGNRKVFTFSTWTKLNSGANSVSFFTAGADAENKTEIGLQSKALRFENEVSNDRDLKDTTALLRDVSQFYHLVFAIDLTQSTNNDKVKMYINGTLQTDFSTDNTFANVDSNINAASTHYIGKRGFSNTRYLDAYMAETHFIDGTQLTADSFGETKQGVWIPKSYTGSYGTNGFYLKFNQTGSGTPSASTRGADSSGNGHHFTTSAVNAADTNLPDTPTNNFCTMNPIAPSNTGTADFSIGDTKITLADNEEAFGTFGVSSGKWYYEVLHISSASSNNKIAIGIADADNPSNNEQVNFGHQATTWGVGDIISVAVDVDAETITFRKNNTAIETDTDWSSKGFTTIVPFLTSANSAGNEVAMFNFGSDSSFNTNKTPQNNSDENGHGDFFYTPPSGFLAMCAANLAEPSISPLNGEKPADYFDTIVFTGNGSSQNVSGLSFQPDWVWLKSRSSANKHKLYDAVRGVEKTISSSGTSAESTESTTLTEFRSDGFAVGSNDAVNKNSDSIVSWSWLAGNSTASNSDGSTSSTVSVNQEAGFSIVSYTGTGSNATVGHGLGVSPKWVIVKKRNGTGDWVVWHQGLGDGTKYMIWDTDQAVLTASNIWNSTAPTSSVFTVGTHTTTNNSSDTYIAYCFAEIEGYSRFRSYTGNGSTDGPFAFTGFRPAWVIFKRSDSTGSWFIADIKRDVINPVGKYLFADLNNTENTAGDRADFLSNGFKTLLSNTNQNANGGTYIYMAFAEQPFKYANAR